jgi:hypothetical protein
MAERAPDASMMAAVERLVRFMAGGYDADLAGIFAPDNVTIIENFPPYVFQGPSAVARWAEGFKAHAETLGQLEASFGTAQDFSVDGKSAYFSLPTTWTGMSKGRRFREEGGWALVLVRQSAEWRVQAYGWAVTDYRLA